MKLSELKDVLYSPTGCIQWAIVYKRDEDKDLENGCSIDYAVANYGDEEVIRISAYADRLVITI